MAPLPTFPTDLSDINPSDLCRNYSLDLALYQLHIEIPVGFRLELEGPTLGDPGDISGKLLAKANAALAPLIPFFDVIDLLLALKELFDAIKSLNPFKIGQVLPKIYVKIDKLKKLIPSLSMPSSIKSLVKVIIVYLQGMRAQLLVIIQEQSNIDLSAKRALAFGAPGLTCAVGCAQVNLDFQLELLRNDAAPLNRLIGTVNLFCSIAELPQIPPVTLAPGAKADEMVSPLTEAIDALQAFHDAIPI